MQIREGPCGGNCGRCAVVQGPQTERLHSKSAEAAVLGSMVQDAKCIPAVLEYLADDSVCFKEHQVIFRAILTVWRRNSGGAMDGVLLRTELESRDELDGVGGLDYLQDVVESTPTTANAVYYAQQVAEKKRYRDAYLAVDAMRKVLDDAGKVDEQVRQIPGLALGLEPEKVQACVFPVSEYATRVAVACRDKMIFIPTHYRALDRLIGGLVPGELSIIAGRPSMGKSSLATGISLNVAKAGKHVLFFTLEMTAKSLMERMISVLSGVNVREVKCENPDQALLNRFDQGALDPEKLPVVIQEGASTPEKQMAAVRSAKQRGPVDVVLVDYLGLMEAGRKVSNRVEEVSIISRKLKMMAMQERIPVVALSQLNRAVEGREVHRPRLSDLRDSGSIEQDGDVVILLHREDYYRRQENPDTTEIGGTTELVITKSRNGPTGTAKLSVALNSAGADKISPGLITLPLLIPASGVASFLSISVRQVWNLHQSGTLGPMPLKLQGRSLWRTDELIAWVRHNCPNRDRWAVIWKSN